MSNVIRERERERERERDRTLDFIKGICILFVLITHYAWSGVERLHFGFTYWVDMAVPVFMTITGYVYAQSFERNSVNTLSDAYEIELVVKRILRYTIPFLFAFIAERLIMRFTGRLTTPSDPMTLLQFFLCGGSGTGAYYYPILIQFIFIYPLIYFTIKKADLKGLLLCLLFNAVFELLKWAYGMPVGCYRLLIFRYVFSISYGCYLAVSKTQIPKRYYVLAFVLGLFFIYKRNHGYAPTILNFWSNTSLLPTLYFTCVFKVMYDCKKLRFSPVELLGKASYQIFLVQMLYYSYGAKYVYSLFSQRMLQLPVGAVLCIVCGLLFYWIDKPLSKKLTAYIMKALRSFTAKEEETPETV